MARSVKITLLGAEMRVQTDDEEGFVERVAAAVNDRAALMRQKGMPSQQVAIFAALKLAEELEREREANAAFRQQVALRMHEFASAVRKEAGHLASTRSKR